MSSLGHSLPEKAEVGLYGYQHFVVRVVQNKINLTQAGMYQSNKRKEKMYNLSYYTSHKLCEQQVPRTWIEITCVGNLKHVLSCSSTRIVA